jgi:hypothetical protein
LPLSVVGGPIDGAGDYHRMVTSGVLSEPILPIFVHIHGIANYLARRSRAFLRDMEPAYITRLTNDRARRTRLGVGQRVGKVGKVARGAADSSGAAGKKSRPAPLLVPRFKFLGMAKCSEQFYTVFFAKRAHCSRIKRPSQGDFARNTSGEGRLLCKIREVTATKRQSACWRLRMHPRLVTEIFISRWRCHGSRLLTGTRKGAIRTRPAGSWRLI